jgi:tetratricopeptide (TPR) repeat protein
MRRRWARVLCLIPVLVGLAWWSMRVLADRRFTAGLARARKEMSSGRFDEAQSWLEALPSSRRSDPDVADLLGVCEHAAGLYEAALTAWSSIPPDSPRWAAAALARAQTLVTNLGRFADAEAVLETALRLPSSSRLDDRVWLAQAGLDTLEGHFEEAKLRLLACTQRRPVDLALAGHCSRPSPDCTRRSRRAGATELSR